MLAQHATTLPIDKSRWCETARRLGAGRLAAGHTTGQGGEKIEQNICGLGLLKSVFGTMTTGCRSHGAASGARQPPSKMDMFTKLCFNVLHPLQAFWVSLLFPRVCILRNCSPPVVTELCLPRHPSSSVPPT